MIVILSLHKSLSFTVEAFYCDDLSEFICMYQHMRDIVPILRL